MSDSQRPKSKGIPSWQRQEPSNQSKQPDDPAPPPSEQAEPQRPSDPQASLTKQASDFLNDDSIRDAPISRKKLFLESKGLSEPEIASLLELPPTPEAAVTEDPNLEQEAPSQPSTASLPQQQNLSSPSQTQPHPPSPTVPSKDQQQQPPIITYPEFLLHAQTPAPLITFPRLLTSLYIASGAAATLYATSTYILSPMLSNLTSARHSLLEGADANITALNTKLEGAVSRIPNLASYSKEEEEEEDGESDTESISADGARFFNRSAGTQTSPRLSRSNSSSSSETEEALSPTQKHTSALQGVHSKLSSLLPAEGELTNPLGDSIGELRAYLDMLPHAASLHPGGKAGKKEIDAFANVKAEIRGVKGVLLSARNFPSGVAAR